MIRTRKLGHLLIYFAVTLSFDSLLLCFTNASVRFLFLMNCSDIIERLDSLWFFSNVVSSLRTEQSAHADKEDAVKEEAPNPKNLIEELKQNESPSPENFAPKCCKCGNFGKEDVEEFAEPEEQKLKKSISNIKRRRRRRRRQGRSKRGSRKIFGDHDHLHLRFDYGNYMDFGALSSDDEEEEEEKKIIASWHHKQVLGSGSVHQPLVMKMPPLEDDMAMKEHLKSWAYAVACTVR